ncbi:MAG: cutinase family protein [Dermatophilaceae bacterium]
MNWTTSSGRSSPRHPAGPGRRRARRWPIIPVVAGLAGTVALLPVSAPPSAAAAECAPVHIIGARGATASEGYGITKGIVDDIKGLVPGSTSAGLKYPARAFDGVLPVYQADVNEGAENLRTGLNALASACPATQTVLIGHSMGANVIGDVLDKDTSPQLSLAAKQALGAVVLLGDPEYRPGARENAPGSPTDLLDKIVELRRFFPIRAGDALDEYTRVAFNPATLREEPVPIVRSYCFPEDLVCTLGLLGDSAGEESKTSHNSYGDPGSPARSDAVLFVKSWLPTPTPAPAPPPAPTPTPTPPLTPTPPPPGGSGEHECFNRPDAATQQRIQTALKARGRYAGPEDGVWGVNSIKGIQTTVTNVGYTGPVDGIPGPNTCRYVQVYAKKFGSYLGPVDGILGPNSWAGFALGLERP